MCWNESVSLNTFLFSIFAICLAYSNGVLTFASSLYYTCYISMQLIEYFAWKNLNNKKINRLISQIALLLIILLPALFIYAEYHGPHKLVLFGFYSICVLFAIITTKHIDFSINKASNGHLAWNWLNFSPLIEFIWLAFILGVMLYNKEYYRFIIFASVVGIIYYIYRKTGTWGSLWCWIANIIAIELIIMVFYKDFCTLPDYKLFNPFD